MGFPLTITDSFVQALTEGRHNFAADTFEIALVNAPPPDVLTTQKLSDLTEISAAEYANLSSREVTLISNGQAGGENKWIIEDLELVASGPVGPFQYFVLYNKTSVDKLVVGWWNYQNPTWMNPNDKLAFDFDQISGSLTVKKV
jgi:hypothetical protein